jgi:hypothetical protein
MKLITAIKIRSFRSVESQEITQLGNLTSLVGKNSSGKSNILRALNLFFNNVVEKDSVVDFDLDYHERPKSRRKKLISVTVDFTLPTSFKYRRGLEHLKALGGEFSITRTWQLDPRRRPFSTYELNCNSEIPNADDACRQFLNLVTYRYVPNRTAPSEVLENEGKALADSLFLRLKGDKHAAALLDSLGTASRRMLSAASDSMSKVGSPLSNPSVSTQDSIGEMLTMGGFQAVGAHGLPVEDIGWGSGHQSFFLFQMLHLLDTNYGRFFGWKQSTIWGIEEPESALHRDLETQLASQLREWTEDSGSRLQIIQTTHSPIFSMASDRGFWVELDGPETSLESMELSDLAVASEVRGVSGWTHPALSFPWNPVILVEGSIDTRVLYHVARLRGCNHLRFLTVRDFESGGKNGKDAMIKWLGLSRKYISNRPTTSPLIAIFDWEVSDQDLNRARSAYGNNGNMSVFRMNEAHCDISMGKDIKGIERFYPKAVLHDAHANGSCVIGVSKEGVISISKSQLDSAKGDLLEGLLKIDDLPSLASLNRVLDDILKAIDGELI